MSDPDPWRRQDVPASSAAPPESAYAPQSSGPPYVGPSSYVVPQFAPPYPGWGQPWQEPRTDPWAIVALTSGVCAWVPVAVVAGIVALIRIRGSHERGRGLAIGALCAAALWTAVFAAGFAFGGDPWSDDYRRGDSAQAAELVVGDCVDGKGQGGQEVVPCVADHDLEVSAVTALPELPPTARQDSRDAIADEMCFAAFEAYVGGSYDGSEFDYGYFSPSAAEWGSGEHRVTCLVRAGSGRLHGSVRDSGR